MKHLQKNSWFTVLILSVVALALVPCARAVDLGNVWPLGDSVTYGAFHAGGYRDTLFTNLTARGCTFQFVGTLTSNPSKRLSDAGQAHHDGHSGWAIANAVDIDGKPRRGLYQGLESWGHSVKRPDTILLMIGINDLNTGYKIDAAPERLDLLISRLFYYYPHTRILIASLPDADGKNHHRHGATNDLTISVKNYNAGIASVVARHKAMGQSITLVNMHAALTLADLHDGLHPNAEGYVKMGDTWADAVVASAKLKAGDETGGTKATTEPATNGWFSLAGEPVASGNKVGKDGLIRKFGTAVLRVTHSSKPESQGTVLLFPGGAYKLLDVLNEGSRTAETLNGFGYDVAMLEYHVNSGPHTRDLALTDALTAWRLLKPHPDALGVDGKRFVLMGYSAGGHLAARVVQNLTNSTDAQPDDLVLVYPAYLDECAAGSIVPKVQPPATPTSRLVVMMATNDRPAWVQGAHAYVDAWRKDGGYAIFQEFNDGGHGFGMNPDLKGDIAQWPQVLDYFLQNGPKPGVGPFNTYLPWFIKNNDGRLATFRKDKAADQGAIVFLGDSITRKWDLTKAFPDLKAANRGIAGDTTRGMLCRLKDNVLDLHPKAIVFMGGINDLSQQPKGTPETIAANVCSVLEQIHAATPDTPVLVCETLPSKTAPLETVQAVNAAVDKVIADFPNAHRVKTYAAFLKPDGTENFSLFLDGTHPNARGYAIWEKILLPELDKYVQTH